ncbi:MAG: isoprenylcysteine carboxylmethyltransferase family protein [Thermodesulfobacteriota bacterium]|nr:MAG: isoprenylcysteine carboxylmethyltransferase family protein [Thermodesulfobacteriota bacterium]
MTYLIMGMAAIFGVGGLLAFMRFLYFEPFGLVNFNLDKSGIMFVDASLCLVFFIQHSGMIRRPVQAFLTRIVPGGCVKAVFAIFSGIFLYAMLLLWQASPDHILVAGGVLRFVLRTVFFIGLFIFFWGIQSMGFYDPTGIRDAIEHMQGKTPVKGSVVSKGPYVFVRHPLYLAMLLLIWSNPVITADRLLFNILWTVWIVVAANLEERDLTAEYGDAYQEYKKKVSMLAPSLRRHPH